jgi:hypothetical protein
MAASSNNSLNYVGYKVDVDDTIQLSCTFEATETSADHIVSFILNLNQIVTLCYAEGVYNSRSTRY